MKKLYRLVVTSLFTLVLLVSPALQSTAYATTSSRVSSSDFQRVGQVVYFIGTDVVKVAQKLYEQGVFTQKQYQIVFSIYAQRLGNKGVNKTVYLGNNLYDNYIDSTTWSLVTSLGLGAVGLLIAAIPRINASLAGFIAGVRIVSIREQ